MARTTFIEACVLMHYEDRYHWLDDSPNLRQIIFFLNDAMAQEGYIPVSELTQLLTDWHISDGAITEQIPLEVKISTSLKQISAIYDIPLKSLYELLSNMEHTCICAGEFRIKAVGVPGYTSIWNKCYDTEE